MAKTASKTNPGRQKGSKATKIYNGKPVRPCRYIHRHSAGKNINFIGAEYEDGKDVIDESSADKMPIRWSFI